MAVVGIPEGRQDHAREACKVGLDLIQLVDGINMKRKVSGQTPCEVRS